MSWVLTILGIMLLILLHELGHFVAAKRVGMRVERFAVFFPPLLAKRRLGETEYGIGAIPLGGYVKITGMNPEEVKTLPPELAKRAYYNQPPWKRIVVILAGPGVNIAIAFFLFWLVLYSGNLEGATALENANPGIRTIAHSEIVIGELMKGDPAASVLRVDDRIVAVNGKRGSYTAAVAAIRATHCASAERAGCRSTAPVTLGVTGPGGRRTVAIYPRFVAATKRMMIGVGFAAKPTAARQFGVLAAGVTAVSEMWHLTTSTFSGLGRAFTNPKVRHELSSIIGIGEVTNQAVATGAGEALVLLGFVSFVLGILNLLPFLPLDGGHVLWAVAEKVRGRRVSLGAMVRFSSVGIILLLFLVVNGFANDISRLTG